MSAADPSTPSRRARSPDRDLVVVVALAAVPWSVQVFSTGDATFLFPWGLVNTNPLHVTTLTDFLFRYTIGLPNYILAWPLGVVLWLLAVASAAVGVVAGREDPRVTGGLLVLAGLTQLSVAAGFSVQPNRVAYPVGTVALWVVAWWRYWPRIRGRT
jgi:uncharacterized protein (TIGR04206 family)